MRIVFPFLVLLVLTLIAACDRGSVGHKPIKRCVPQGQCDPSMFKTGLTAAAGDAGKGAGLFQQHCATCHGPDGRGTVQAPGIDLTSAVWQSRYRDGEIASIIRGGRPPKMPAFSLPDAQLRDLVAHVRSLKRAMPKRKQGY